jgi:hypothetical protein
MSLVQYHPEIIKLLQRPLGSEYSNVGYPCTDLENFHRNMFFGQNSNFSPKFLYFCTESGEIQVILHAMLYGKCLKR